MNIIAASMDDHPWPTLEEGKSDGDIKRTQKKGRGLFRSSSRLYEKVLYR